MKKVISIFLTITIVFSIICSNPFSMDVNASASGTTGKCTWSKNGSVLTISGNGAMADYSTYSGSSMAPWGTSITKVIIENGVTNIGAYAFFRCESLASVQIANTVLRIGECAFYNCENLNQITIPDSVSTIGDRAFTFCDKLSNVIIEDSCDIRKDAFYDCSSLTSITFGGRISAYQDAFYGCDNLGTVYMNSVENWCRSYFENASANPIYAGGADLYLNNQLVINLVIPDDVKSIGRFTFYYYKNLVSVTMGSGVESIGTGAFGFCNPINIYIKDVASWCNIEFDSQPLLCGGDLYLNNKLLTNLTIPSKVKKINDSAFYSCDHLQSVSISEGVEYIGEKAFYDCSYLENIELPSSLTYVGDYAFAGCDNINKKICNNGMYIGNSTNPFLMLVDTETTSFRTFELSSDTRFISSSAFGSCHNFTDLFLPNHILGIGDYAFYDCPLLQDVWYYGSDADKENIAISSDGNDSLKNATWHYDTCVNEHSYVSECDSTCEKCEWKRYIEIDGNLEHRYLLNENLTCDVCGYSKQPEKPVVINHFSGIVELAVAEGMEYSKDGVTWQKSNVFSGLTGNMTYIFYQRVKTTSTAQESEASEGLSVYLKATQSKPSAPTVSSYTDKTVTLIWLAGVEYSIDGITWQQSNIFKNLSSGTEYTFYQRYAETGTHEASETSAGKSVTTDKSKQTFIPTVPTVQSVTASSITLVAVSGCEYSMDGVTWQASNVFSGLSCGTDYTFYQRYEETSSTYVGKSSEGATFKTDKGTQSEPSAPTLESKTHNRVILRLISGYEYSRDGINWQVSNEFTDLSPETNYLFYQRKAETETHYASECSDYLIVRTEEAPECILDSLLHQYDDTCDTDCNVCGFERTIEHTYSNACDTTCNICEETRSIIHNYKTTTTQATLSKNGSIVKKCTVCGEVASKSSIYYPRSFALSTIAYTYTGGKKTPSVTVKDSRGKKLVNGTDYKLTYSSSTRKSIGRYSVKITFKGNYSGSKTLYFTIGPKNPTSVKATLYGHDDVKVTWNKVSGASGYKVYYKKSTSNTWSSKTTTGTSMKLANLADGVKYDIKVVTYKTIGGYKCYNAGKSTSIYTLKKVAGIKAQKSGTKVKVSWTNISGETGYQISQSTKKSGTNIVATYKTTSGKYKTISATKGKTYYYKVRAYKVVSGKKIYSPWSTAVKYVRK